MSDIDVVLNSIDFSITPAAPDFCNAAAQV